MPWCPNCRYEYVAGIEICPECRVAMVEELEPLPPKLKFLDDLDPAPSHPVVLLYTAGTQVLADEIASFLLSNGIPALTRSIALDYFVKYYTGRVAGEVGVYISESQMTQAKELLGLDESPVPFWYREAEEVEEPVWDEEALDEEDPI